MSAPTTIPADLARALALARPRLGPFAGRLVWYEEVPSTNDIAGAMADGGADEGVVVVANHQTSGRGRLGRGWASPAGAGLYVSAVLRPTLPALSLLTIAAGVAVAEGIEAASGLRVELKWPNDVHIAGRKLAGILAEAAERHVVLGIGINILEAAFPPEVSVRATSLEGELGRAIDRWLVLTECLAALAFQYDRLHQVPHAGLLEAWRARAASTLGRSVEWEAAGTRHRGEAEDIAEDGALIVRSPSGQVRVRAGVVRWL